MKATELCPAPHLEAADLDGDTPATITGVAFNEVGDKAERKGVVMLKEFARGMVLNRTNLKRIIALHGNDTDGWLGKSITLYPTQTSFGGKEVPCIRVREHR